MHPTMSERNNKPFFNWSPVDQCNRLVTGSLKLIGRMFRRALSSVNATLPFREELVTLLQRSRFDRANSEEIIDAIDAAVIESYVPKRIVATLINAGLAGALGNTCPLKSTSEYIVMAIR